MVGELYSTDEPARRDAGFSIFYMGINLGAFIAPLITSYLGEKIEWHYGFAVAGLGMLIGVIQYRLTEHHLGEAGLYPTKLPDPELQAAKEKKIRIGLWSFSALFSLLVALIFVDVVTINPIAIAQTSTYVIAVVAVLFFAKVFLFEKLNVDEKKRVGVIAIFFLTSCFFYAGYEQQGSSFNLFAKSFTDRTIEGWEMPAGSFQSISPIFVVIFSPIFAWLWVWLARKQSDPSSPIKLALGVVCMGLGYLVMVGASMVVVSSMKAASGWLIFTYLLHTFGEILLYPVGLSAMTKLSPKKLVGQMMGLWFMSIALGNRVAGLFAGEFDA
ncbi:MAG: peptide MFS transporter, partial [Cyclobacteriaceae bacterium]